MSAPSLLLDFHIASCSIPTALNLHAKAFHAVKKDLFVQSWSVSSYTTRLHMKKEKAKQSSPYLSRNQQSSRLGWLQLELVDWELYIACLSDPRALRNAATFILLRKALYTGTCKPTFSSRGMSRVCVVFLCTVALKTQRQQFPEACLLMAVLSFENRSVYLP